MIKQNATAINTIRNLLLSEWDPLNIGENPNLSDEYDSYIPIILRALIEKDGIDKLSMLLYKIEREDIGLDGDLEKCYRAATTLQRVDLESL